MGPDRLEQTPGRRCRPTRRAGATPPRAPRPGRRSRARARAAPARPRAGPCRAPEPRAADRLGRGFGARDRVEQVAGFVEQPEDRRAAEGPGDSSGREARRARRSDRRSSSPSDLRRARRRWNRGSDHGSSPSLTFRGRRGPPFSVPHQQPPRALPDVGKVRGLKVTCRGAATRSWESSGAAAGQPLTMAAPEGKGEHADAEHDAGEAASRARTSSVTASRSTARARS